ATPYVTGVVALVWSQHPTWSYQQVISQVLNTATRTAALTGKVRAGLVNAAAVGAVQISSTAPVVVNAVNPSGSTTSMSTIRVTFDRAMNTSSFTTADVVLTGPSGGVPISAVKAVAGYGNKVFDIAFATQTKVGNYVLRVGPNVTDPTGKAMTTFQKTFTLKTTTTTTAPHVVKVINLNSSNTSISTIRVSFDRAMNPSSFTTADVVLTGPDGRSIAIRSVKVVVGFNNNIYDI